MHILVTGGGGFIGSALIKKLISLEYKVTSLSRSFYPHLQKMNINQIQLDLSNSPEELFSTLSKVHQQSPITGVFHVASKVAMWGRWKDFYSSNIIATENLVKVCQRLKIKHFIYTSTPSVVYNGKNLKGGDETLPYTKSKDSFYAYSKAIAERYILRQNSASFKTLAIRPHLVFGPGDQNLIPNILKKAGQRRLKIIGKGLNQVDISYIDNVVDAHILSLEALQEEKPVGGEAFFIGQGPIRLWDFINQVLQYQNLPLLNSKVSTNLVFYVSWMFELIFKVLGIQSKEPPITRFVVNQLANDHYFDHQKAQDLLGWQAKKSIDEGLRSLFIS